LVAQKTRRRAPKKNKQATKLIAAMGNTWCCMRKYQVRMQLFIGNCGRMTYFKWCLAATLADEELCQIVAFR
jgi:hypothetical protein